MIKTKKEIEKEFDKLFTYIDKDDESGIIPRRDWRPTFQLPGEEIDCIKFFIHQIRIADLEEMEKWLMNEKKKYRPTAAVCNEEVIFTYSKVRYHIKKVKKEIGK